MRKILITGENSYIGTSFEKYIKEIYPNDYIIDTVDMKGNIWHDISFTGYDCIFHVAGIAHQKETNENAHLYYEINRDLAYEVAKKAKKDGVKQFVFLSSMSVYGRLTGIITKNMQPNPTSNYGKSKLQAEQLITKLMDESFKIAIIRPPMVYGEGCKGNYNTLITIAKKSPIIPNYKNQRSLISIDNLTRFVEWVVKNGCTGIYRPQDRNYICTCDMICEISKRMNKSIKRVNILNPVAYLASLLTKKGKKAFGTLIYTDLEEYEML